jgi:hypothetical protein
MTNDKFVYSEILKERDQFEIPRRTCEDKGKI